MYERKNIIIQAPVFSLSGYGRHSQDIVMSLFNSGLYNISVVPVGWGNSSLFQPTKEIDDALVFMCNNRISDNAEFAFIKIGVPHEFQPISKTCNIGITAGLEVEQYPNKWAEYCNRMTAIIVPTTFAKDRLIQCGTTVPIYVIPEGVDTTIFNIDEPSGPHDPTFEDQLNALPTNFNFLTVGQWLPGVVGEDRKNIPATAIVVINALLDNTDVGVIVKTNLHNNSSPDRYALIERFSEIIGPKAKGRVHLLHGTLTEQEMKTLYTHPKIKAFISLTHGEGYFRPLAEAMACDLPVIVTGWSGHMDFVKPELTTIIGYDMVQVPQASWQPELLGPGQTWANPVFEEAENRVRRCYNSYSIAKDRAKKMGEIIRNDWSLNKMEKQFSETLTSLLIPTDTHTAQVGRIIL